MKQASVFRVAFALAACLLFGEGAQTRRPAVALDAPLEIQVWWLDALYDFQIPDVANLLQAQIEAFNAQHEDYQVRLRLKRESGEGSALTTLMAAQYVAPSALPDLVLLPSADLPTAVERGVVLSLEPWLPDTLRADVKPSILALGQIENNLYGFPYAVELTHAVYQPTAFPQPPTTFTDILEAEGLFVMAGLPPQAQKANPILVAQYMAAGGRFIDGEGRPTLEKSSLGRVLRFYEQVKQRRRLAAEGLNFTSPSEYWGRVLAGEFSYALTTSSLYLRTSALSMDGPPLALAPLPSPQQDAPLIVMRGWVWTLTTSIPNQQDAALTFLEWMMGAENQATYTEAFGVIPSRTRALRLWTNQAYVEQVQDWLPVAQAPASRDSVAVEQLQAAFQAILTGNLGAEEAAEQALKALAPAE